jgi:DNA-binding NtrC family response regulator
VNTFKEIINAFDGLESEDTKKYTILIIDDDKSIQKGFKRYFSHKYNIIAAYDGKRGIELLSKELVHCIILDVKMKGMNGFEVYPALKVIKPKIPIIFYSGFQNEHDIKIILNKYQPEGYFAKGDEIEYIELVIDKAIEEYLVAFNFQENNNKLKAELEQTKQNLNSLKRKIQKEYKFNLFKGSSSRMMEFKNLLKKAINSDITVLIQGETGTGKELIANIIHSDGSRPDNKFFIQNCAAIPENLFESEFFGHKKGSFTGAFKDRKGIFKRADKGTVFLDEVGDLPLPMQAKLLRLLQEGEIKQVGSDKNEYVDVRIISATNKNLADEVKKGKFRSDLYYRLSVFALFPPPLREIKEDIPFLINFFLKKYKKNEIKKNISITKDALKIIINYTFPGNVRELENEIERAVVMLNNSENVIGTEHLSDKIVTFNKDSVDVKTNSLKEMVMQFEKNIIIHKLNEHKGNKTQVAKNLNLSRVGLNNKIRRYHID